MKEEIGVFIENTLCKDLHFFLRCVIINLSSSQEGENGA